MGRQPPESKLHDTLLPDPTLFRSTVHQVQQGAGQLHPSVRLLVVLEQRHEDARARQGGVVERVYEAHLALAVAPAKVRAARLPVVQGRAAVRLAIFAKRRHPAFDVVHAELAETHVRSEEHTSELQSLMRSSYAVFC